MGRNGTIDVVKGGLIVFVIVGHLLPGEPHASLARWVIYSFHMPLFIAVSGYLFSWEKIGGYSLAGVFAKYRRRLIVPWLIALAVYAAVDVSGSLFSGDYWVKFVRHFIPPFFHLWFVATYLLFVLLSWVLLRLRCTLSQVLIVSVVIAIISDGLRHWIHPSYFVFFVLGGFWRVGKVGLSVKLVSLLALLLLGGEVLLFYYPNAIFEPVVFFALNFCLIRLMVAFIESGAAVRQPLLEWIGVNSLGIYLWHVLPLMLVFRLHLPSLWESYLLDVGSMVVLFVIIRVTLRVPVVGRLLYGV